MPVNLKNPKARAQELRKQLALQMRFEKKFTPEYAKYFKKMYADVVKHILNNKNFTPASAAKVVDSHKTKLRTIINQNHMEVGTAFGYRLLDRIEELKEESAFDAAMLAWSKKISGEQAVLISENQKKYLKNILQGWLDQSEGFTHLDIAKSLEDVAPSLERWQSLRIARTETHNAAMFGSETMAVESEIIDTKEWVYAGDERTRTSHKSIKPNIIPLDKKFNVNGSKMSRPGDPAGPAKEVVNCRCILIYGFDE